MEELQQQQYHSPCKRAIVFITSLLANCSFAGLLGTFAMAKKYLGDEIQVEEGFLGIVDGMTFFARVFGLLYLTFFPSKKPLMHFMIASTVITGCLSLVPLSSYFNSWGQVILLISFSISGLCRCFTFLPYFIVSQYFDSTKQDKGLILFWTSCFGFGDAFSVIGMSYLISWMGWKMAFITCILFFFLMALLLYLSADEVSMARNQQQEFTFSQTFEEIKQFFGRAANVLFLIDFAMIYAAYALILVWFPYYFLHQGLVHRAAFISCAVPLCCPFGSIIWNRLSQLFPTYHGAFIFASFGLTILTNICLCLLQVTVQNYWLFVIVCGLMGLCLGYPYSYFSSVEVDLRATNNRQKYMVLAEGRGLYNVVTFFSTIGVGYLMEAKLRNLFYFLSGYFCFEAILSISRYWAFGLPEPKNSVGELVDEEDK